MMTRQNAMWFLNIISRTYENDMHFTCPPKSEGNTAMVLGMHYAMAYSWAWVDEVRTYI